MTTEQRCTAEIAENAENEKLYRNGDGAFGKETCVESSHARIISNVFSLYFLCVLRVLCGYVGRQ